MTDALREKLINAGRVLVDEGQGDYVWGHIAARLPGSPGQFLMKPGCIGLEELTVDNIITVDIEGEKVAGDWPRARELQYTLSRLWLLFRDQYPSSLKGGMVIMGRPVGPTRAPLPTATRERQDHIRAQLEELGILESEPYGW